MHTLIHTHTHALSLKVWPPLESVSVKFDWDGVKGESALMGGVGGLFCMVDHHYNVCGHAHIHTICISVYVNVSNTAGD